MLTILTYFNTEGLMSVSIYTILLNISCKGIYIADI